MNIIELIRKLISQRVIRLGKQQVIRHYQREAGYKILVETGTYFGEMVNSQKNNFDKIISIELDNNLYKRAFDKFKKYKHIKILNGDGGEVLNDVCKELDKPAIFWLDGHYSGGITAKGKKETPICEELKAIFKKNYNHIILIDDARLFIGENDYPTIVELSRFIKQRNSEYNIEVKEDIIRAVPKNIMKSHFA
ncbi:hypothetical protein CO015_04855 [candidate division WWE3 bacterium CG_4_8_14_3_um_filter_42_11]|nr:MAG: hypothetical protein CO015_04855 [candidate division WWE3 bacterium CG_4_8_14_3_um_filter_42_11]